MQVLRRRHTVLQCYGTALFWLKPEPIQRGGSDFGSGSTYRKSNKIGQIFILNHHFLLNYNMYLYLTCFNYLKLFYLKLIIIIIIIKRLFVFKLKAYTILTISVRYDIMYCGRSGLH